MLRRERNRRNNAKQRRLGLSDLSALLNEAATRRNRLAEPHDLFCIFTPSNPKDVILQYFMRINQHDERHGGAF